MSSSSKGAFKICFNNQIHKVLNLPNDLKALKTLVIHFFGLQLPTEWKLQYIDADGDAITVTNDFDYKTLLEEKSVRVNIVPIEQSLARKIEEANSVKALPQKPSTNEVEEISDFYSESGYSEPVSFLTAGDFGYPGESLKKNSYQTLSQMRDKQRRRALRVVDNLKRTDLSTTKKENLKTQLEEIKETIDLLKKKQMLAESTAAENVLILEKPQTKENGAMIQEKAAFSANKKQLASRKRANIKRDLKNLSYQNDFEEMDFDEEGYEVSSISKQMENKGKEESQSVTEKARKIKEIFTNIDVEILSFFLKENPQLKIEEVIQNYITV